MNETAPGTELMTQHNQQLAAQLDLWATATNKEWNLEKPVEPEDLSDVFQLITEANEVAGIVAGPEYQAVLEKKRNLAGSVRLGIIGCVDGRRKRNFPLGFVTSSTEVPAGEIVTRGSNGHLIPESTILATALDRAASPDEDLLQFAEAHTSFTTDHKCGAIGLKKAVGEISDDVSFEEAGLDIASKTLGVVTEHHNRARALHGLEALETAGVTILYDTDTMGYVLGYEKKGESGGALSTTTLTKQYRSEIAKRLASEVGDFGSMRETFMQSESVLPLAQRTLKIEEYLVTDNNHFTHQLTSYIDTYYPNLTDRQKRGLRYTVATTVVFQYLTGLCDAADQGHPDHPFAPHNEHFMAISPDGKTFGGRHPGTQVFGTSPSDIKAARIALHVEIGIREKVLEEKGEPLFHPIFATVAVDQSHMTSVSPKGALMPDDNEVVQRAQARLIDFVRGLWDDPDLRARIQSGNVMIIPGLIDQRTRMLLRIPPIAHEV